MAGLSFGAGLAWLKGDALTTSTGRTTAGMVLANAAANVGANVGLDKGVDE